jgi:hypothetical protein
MSTRKPRDTYHERGPTYHVARNLYLTYPLWPSAIIAEILEVSRQAVDEYTRDLKGERARLRGLEITRLRGKYASVIR